MNAHTISREAPTTVAGILGDRLDGWRGERCTGGAIEWDHTTLDGQYHRVRLYSTGDTVEIWSPHTADVDVSVMVTDAAGRGNGQFVTDGQSPALYHSHPADLVDLFDALGVPEVNE